MVAVQRLVDKDLLVLTPLVRSAEHNVVRINRTKEIDAKTNKVLHAAGGEHLGIVVNSLSDTTPPEEQCDVALSFSVWVTDGDSTRQENRQLRFCFDQEVDHAEKHSLTQQFFKDLVNTLPRDYVSFLKRVLKLMQNGYGPLIEVDVDMQFVKAEEAMPMPDPKEYESDSEVENVNVGHVKDVLEHAYPNGLTVDIIAEALRCTAAEVEDFLHELENQGVVKKVEKEWIRVDTVNTTMNKTGPMIKEHPPTVAIITCLFVEKQSVDAIIDDSTTVHRYKSGGDSNIYTLGWIGPHRVVATKLAVIGDSREATTSAGSITTRLLGNFQYIEHVFIVGVGGGVAHYTDADMHVRLGDVVVSSSNPDAYVFSHTYTIDRETENVNGFVVRKWNPQDNVVARIAKNVDESFLLEWGEISKSMSDKLSATLPDFSLSRPKPETDLLTLPIGGGNMVVVPHPNQYRTNPVVHVGPVGAMAAYKRPVVEEEADGETTRDAASHLRDRFVAEYNLRAVDAGFDSVIAAVNGSRIDSWVLIRGIADYQHGQSRAGRNWQAYAGIQAAALTKSLILRLPTSDTSRDQ